MMNYFWRCPLIDPIRLVSFNLRRPALSRASITPYRLAIADPALP
jgi:hypothetical protein